MISDKTLLLQPIACRFARSAAARPTEGQPVAQRPPTASSAGARVHADGRRVRGRLAPELSEADRTMLMRNWHAGSSSAAGQVRRGGPRETCMVNQACSGLLAAHSNKVHDRDTTNCRSCIGWRHARDRGLIVLALAAPLGGCFSLTAQKPVPEWAMATQAQAIEQSVAAAAPREPGSDTATCRRGAYRRSGHADQHRQCRDADR